MRNLPFLGEPLDESLVWVCGYAETPGEGVCGRDAAWHGFVLDDPARSIAAMMESCEDHVGQMRLTADYVHPLKHPCGIPGSRFRWPENECYTEWDAVAELAAVSEMAGAQ